MIKYENLRGQSIYEFAKQKDCYILGPFPQKIACLIERAYNFPVLKLLDYAQFNTFSTDIKLNIVVASSFIDWFEDLLSHPIVEYKNCNFYVVKGETNV